MKKSKAMCKCENGEIRKRCKNRKRLMQNTNNNNNNLTKKSKNQKSKLNKNATSLAN
jgi:hypothetical protein